MFSIGKKYLSDYLPCSTDQAWNLSLLLIEELKKIENDQNQLINFHPSNIEYSITNELVSIKLPSPDGLDNLPITYISPEETGRVPETPDYRSNFYRLGIVFYELFSGRPPFPGKDRLKVYWQHIAQSPTPIASNEQLLLANNIILKLLQKSKENRYQSIKGLVYDWELAYEYSKGGEIGADIKLGSKDLSPIFSVPKVFIGRNKELRTVYNIIDNVENNNGKGLVIVSGPKYIGKSFFLRHIIENYKSRSYILLDSDGKLDNIAPYNLLVQAFNKYLRYLQLSDAQNMDFVRQNILIQLGSNTAVFTSFAPEWESLLGTFNSPVVLGQRETVLRLSFVISNVLSILSNKETPIIFTVDNLELASNQSLALLSLILSEGDIKKFVFLAAFQKNENNSKEIEIYKKLQSSALSLQSDMISIPGLDEDEVADLLINSKINSVDVHSIKKFISQATYGNPYLIKELADKAFSNNLITADSEKNCWTIDVDKIKTIKLSIDSSNFDRIIIDGLTYDELNIAQICACIGMSFDKELIGEMASQSREDVHKILSSLHSKDLIIPYGSEGNYMFINENIQSLILHNFDKNEQLLLTKKIINCLVGSENYLSSAQSIYTFLRYVLSLPDEDVTSYKEQLLIGITEAKKIGGLQEATSYYHKLLRAKLYNSAAEKFDFEVSLMEVYIGLLDFVAYNKLKDTMVIGNSYSLIQIAKLDALHCKALSGQQRFGETVQYAIDSLKKLDVNIVKKPSLLRVIYGVVTAGIAIKSKSMEELETLPETQDLKSLQILNILRDASSSFFLSSPESLPGVLSLQIKMAISNGINDTIGLVFSTYGFTVSSFNKDFKKSEEMMELAYKLNERFNDKTSQSVSQFLHYGLTSHWVRPNRFNASKLMGNYRYSLEAGQQVMAYYSMGLADIIFLFSGLPLSKLQTTITEHRRICKDKRQLMIVDFHSILLQLIENLTSDKLDPPILEGSYFSMRESLPRFENSSQHTTRSVMYAAEGLQKLLLQNYENSLVHLLILHEHLSKSGLSSFSTLMGYIFHLLCALQDETIPLSKSKKYLDKVKEWASYGKLNFGGWYHLCQAVYYKRVQDKPQFFYHIDSASLWFETNEILYAEAYAKLLKIEFISEVLQLTPSNSMIMNVVNLFNQWGASTICDRLERKYNINISNTSEIPNTKNAIDLASILSASTSIASEMKLDNLLDKLTTILIQNAGAQKVVIFQYLDRSWYEVANKSDNNPVVIHQQPLNELLHPLSLITIAKNSMQPLIVQNIDVFAYDKYLQKQQPLSSMILPVIKNNDITAIIYLENSLIKGVFSPERVELVSLLSGQVAISMENALLYKDLEQRVVSRTNELTQKNTEIEANNKKLSETLIQLQSAQAQLIQSEKLASLGELTAGIAHEIQNPLNFVNNFSEVSNELIDEMKEELSIGNEHWIKGNLVEANVNLQNTIEIANDLKANLTKINQHGLRASSIVKGMLEHSRKSTGEKISTDFNSLCDEYLRLAFHGLRAKDKTFNADFEFVKDELLSMVEVIPQDMSRVLLNLINNAFWAVNDKKLKLGTSEFKPKVTVSTQQSATDIIITIIDNGNGIPQENIEKIFQPFFTTKPSGQGTGLGLSLSYDIVKAHKGELSVKSIIGEGTEFKIIIPINK